MNRRKFLQGASTACSLMIVKPSVAFSYAANSAVQACFTKVRRSISVSPFPIVQPVSIPREQECTSYRHEVIERCNGGRASRERNWVCQGKDNFC